MASSNNPIFHVTLAYLKPGMSWLYVGEGLNGHEVVLNELIFSDKDRNHTAIDLYDLSKEGVQTKALKESNEEGWGCQEPPCEWGLLSAGAENLHMEAPGGLTTIHNQENWERAHPDRWERSEVKDMEAEEKGFSRPGLGNDYTFYRQAFDRWRTKPDVLGERRLHLAYERGKPPQELAIQNDEEFRITQNNNTKESQHYHATHPSLPAEAGLTPGEELEDQTTPRCPDGQPLNPSTRTCTQYEGHTGGYPGVDEMHIEQDDRHVGGQRAGKSVYTQKCPNGDPFPIGSGSCQGRQADSWDGLVDNDNKAPWGSYPDTAPATGLDTRPTDEKEEPRVGPAAIQYAQGKAKPICPDGRAEAPNIRSCGGAAGWKGWMDTCPDGTPMSPNTETCAGREGWVPFTEEERLQRTLMEPPKGPASSQEEGPITAKYPNSPQIAPSPFGKGLGRYERKADEEKPEEQPLQPATQQQVPAQAGPTQAVQTTGRVQPGQQVEEEDQLPSAPAPQPGAGHEQGGEHGPAQVSTPEQPAIDPHQSAIDEKDLATALDTIAATDSNTADKLKEWSRSIPQLRQWLTWVGSDDYRLGLEDQGSIDTIKQLVHTSYDNPELLNELKPGFGPNEIKKEGRKQTIATLPLQIPIKDAKSFSRLVSQSTTSPTFPLKVDKTGRAYPPELGQLVFFMGKVGRDRVIWQARVREVEAEQGKWAVVIGGPYKSDPDKDVLQAYAMGYAQYVSDVWYRAYVGYALAPHSSLIARQAWSAGYFDANNYRMWGMALPWADVRTLSQARQDVMNGMVLLPKNSQRWGGTQFATVKDNVMSNVPTMMGELGLIPNELFAAPGIPKLSIYEFREYEKYVDKLIHKTNKKWNAILQKDPYADKSVFEGLIQGTALEIAIELMRRKGNKNLIRPTPFGRPKSFGLPGVVDPPLHPDQDKYRSLEGSDFGLNAPWDENIQKAMSAYNTTTGGALVGAKPPKKKLTGQPGETRAQLSLGHPSSSSFQEPGASWNFDPLNLDKFLLRYGAKALPPKQSDHQPTLAVDVDGTLCATPLHTGRPPSMAEMQPREGAVEAMQQLHNAGWRLIAWTVRDDYEDLKEWLELHEIPVDFINENPDQPTTSPKIIADYYVDDRAIPADSWPEIIQEIEARSKSLCQPAGSYQELIELGSQTLPGFQQALQSLSLPMVPLESFEEQIQEPGGLIVMAPLKGEARATEKVDSDYNGDWSRLTDVLRASVAVDSLDEIKLALETLSHTDLKPVRVKDRFKKPLGNSYRDLLVNYQAPNGMITEVQFHLKEILAARERERLAYDVVRAIRATLKEEGRDTMTGGEMAAVQRARDTSSQLFRQAWDSYLQSQKQLPAGQDPQEPEVEPSPYEHWYKNMMLAYPQKASTQPYTGMAVDSLGRKYCYTDGRKVPCGKGNAAEPASHAAPHQMPLGEQVHTPTRPAVRQERPTKIEEEKPGQQIMYAVIFNKDGQLLVRENDPWGGFVWSGKKQSLSSDLEQATGLGLVAVGKAGPYTLFRVKSGEREHKSLLGKSKAEETIEPSQPKEAKPAQGAQKPVERTQETTSPYVTPTQQAGQVEHANRAPNQKPIVYSNHSEDVQQGASAPENERIPILPSDGTDEEAAVAEGVDEAPAFADINWAKGRYELERSTNLLAPSRFASPDNYARYIIKKYTDIYDEYRIPTQRKEELLQAVYRQALEYADRKNEETKSIAQYLADPIEEGKPIQERVAAYQNSSHVKELINSFQPLLDKKKELENRRNQANNLLENSLELNENTLEDAQVEYHDVLDELDEYKDILNGTFDKILFDYLKIDAKWDINIVDELGAIGGYDVKSGIAWLRRMVAHSVDGFPDHPVALYHNENDLRSSYNIFRNSLTMGANFNIRTLIHEYGHYLEGHIPGLLKTVLEFRAYRVGNEKPTQLSRKFPDNEFDDDEYGYRDSFDKVFGDRSTAYYAGKIYESYADGGGIEQTEKEKETVATEILSTFLEELYANPAELYANDPEIFFFLVGICKGYLRTSQRRGLQR